MGYHGAKSRKEAVTPTVVFQGHPKCNPILFVKLMAEFVRCLILGFFLAFWSHVTWTSCREVA